jgi:hypothetical protein
MAMQLKRYVTAIDSSLSNQPCITSGRGIAAVALSSSCDLWKGYDDPSLTSCQQQLEARCLTSLTSRAFCSRGCL